MPDCFISYASCDETQAFFARHALESQGLDVFLASQSIEPGADWEKSIREALRNTNWVILLASREACESRFVNQELGAAWFSEKTIIPVIWDISPEELPGWVDRRQALDLHGRSVWDLRQEMEAIAERIKADRNKGLLILGALVSAILFLASRD